MEANHNIETEAVEVILQSIELPRTLTGLQRSRDMVEWRLEASAWELTLLLKERKQQLKCLAHLDELIKDFEAGEGSDEGEQVPESEEGDEGEGGEEGGEEGDEGEESEGGGDSSTVAGSGAGGALGDMEVDGTLE